MLLLQKYPADAIRYWTASGRLGQDMMFSEEQLTIGQKLITKLWNAFKFAEPHLANLARIVLTPASPETFEGGTSAVNNGYYTPFPHALKNTSTILNNKNLA